MANGNFEGTVEKHTVHAHAAEAAARGSVLMVQSLKPPRYSVPYPEYVEELRELDGSISEEAEVALAAIREHVSPRSYGTGGKFEVKLTMFERLPMHIIIMIRGLCFSTVEAWRT